MASTGEVWLLRRLPMVIGAVLLAVAGLGPLAWDLFAHPAAPTLSGFDDPRVQRRAGEPVVSYVRRVNRAVAAAVYHCEPTTPQTWAAALLAPISPAVGSHEGILDLSRLRCGFCSQVSFIESQILRRNGVEALGRGLDGHVVVAFRAKGRDWVADPDFGVGPFPVNWSDSAALATTARVQYARYPATPPGMRRAIADVYVDTSADAPQNPYPLLALADQQARQLAAVEALRWVLVAVGMALLTGGLVTSRRAASRNEHSPRPRVASLRGS